MKAQQIEDLEEECLEYRNGRDMLPEYIDNNPVHYWAQVCKLNKFPILIRLVCAVMSLPHGNADVERLFSAMNNVKTSLRNQLGQDTLTAILMIKTNNSSSCFDFKPTQVMVANVKSATYQHHMKRKAAQPCTASANKDASDSIPSTSNDTITEPDCSTPTTSTNLTISTTRSADSTTSTVTTTSLAASRAKRQTKPKEHPDFMKL